VLILLPPSETKRAGGDQDTRLDLAALSLPELTRARRETLRDLRALSRDRAGAIAALRLGPTQHAEVAINRSIGTSPTMPAIDRYTGVLFDALDAASLSPSEREHLGRTVLIHSAALGPVGALDAIPAYRLSHDSRLPGRSLRAIWSTPVAEVLARRPGLILDARSEGYAALGPAPAHDRSIFLRVVAAHPDGRRRALNHFNKHAKGLLARALGVSEAEPDSVDDLIDWGAATGFRLERSADAARAELLLVTEEPSPRS
jgi:cytoplasmic iron level regulating protein YaaA (DUF328/UPF0246 family)